MKMTVRRVIAMLEEQDPEANVAVLIHGHAIPVIDNIEEGVVTDTNPHGTLYLKIGDE